MANASSRTAKRGNVAVHAGSKYRNSPGRHCVVFGCQNNQRKRSRLLSAVCDEHNIRRESCRCGVFSLHRLPSATKNAKLRHQWIAALNRKNYEPSENSRVCSEHFLDHKPTERNPVPMLRLGYSKKVVKGRRLLIRQAVSPVKKPRQYVAARGQPSSGCDKQDQAESVEDNVVLVVANAGTSLCAATQPLTAACPQQEQQIIKQQVHTSQHVASVDLPAVDALSETAQIETPDLFKSTVGDTSVELYASEPQELTSQLLYFAPAKSEIVVENTGQVQAAPTFHFEKSYDAEALHTFELLTMLPVSAPERAILPVDISPECVQRILHEHCYFSCSAKYVDAGTQTSFYNTFSLAHRQYQFYTGLSYCAFCELVKVVDSKVSIQFKLTISDAVLLTLMRLRLGLLYADLAYRFAMSVSLVGKIFRTVLRALAEISRQHLIIWLPRETIQRSLPKTFKESIYKSTRCIIDCTEVHMQRPKKLYARAQTYSQYKGGNTAKFLVAIAPTGFVMFVSKVYGGRASDRFIVQDSGFGDYLENCDGVMADRGFTLNEEMKAKSVRLNMPAFTQGRTRLEEVEVTRTRRIASLRIHVERAINRIKTFRTLKYSVPIHHKKLVNDIVVVCAGLCNLKSCLIRSDVIIQEDGP